MPHSKANEAVARLLQENGFLNSVHVADATIGKTLSITINSESENAKITEITRLSKPGRRFYTKSKEIPTVKHGRGLVIVSTSKGMMTGKDAQNQGVGGELICKVY
jgi:small subunit ribosomal protein S8